MNINTAVASLGALAHETRLQVFRLLVRAGEEGMSVGRIAEMLGVEANGSFSFHLKELVQAGLAKTRQEGRYIYYVTQYEAMNELLRYLTEDCCGGMSCEAVVETCNPKTHKSRKAA